MPTLTVYPEAHAESTSWDGRVSYNIPTGDDWANLVAAAAGGLLNDTGTTNHACLLEAHASSVNKYATLARGFFLFNTSALTAAAVISAAVVSLYGQAKSDALVATPNVNIYSSNPASNTSVTDTDFATVGSTPFCDTPVTYAAFTISGYNDFTLNAAGLAAISKTGITKFSSRNSNYDVANIPPPWVADSLSRLTVYNADQSGATYDPKLVITYTIPTTGALDKTLDALVASAAGIVLVQGQLAKTLADISPSIAGEVLTQGVLSKTLDGIAASSSGAVLIRGLVAKTLDTVGLAATGTGQVSTQGTLTATLDSLGISAAGVVPVVGQLAKVLQDAVGTGTGTVYVSGVLAQTLADVLPSATGKILVVGQAAAGLADLQLVASGNATGEILGELIVLLEDLFARGRGTEHVEPTPAERTIIVAYENRAIVVAFEDRAIVVPFENRTVRIE